MLLKVLTIKAITGDWACYFITALKVKSTNHSDASNPSTKILRSAKLMLNRNIKTIIINNKNYMISSITYMNMNLANDKIEVRSFSCLCRTACQYPGFRDYQNQLLHIKSALLIKISHKLHVNI